MPWLNDLVTQLQAEGVGTFNADIFASSKAVPPVLASGFATIVIIDTGGTDPEKTHNSVILPAYLRPSAQLTARADSYEAADAKARAAYAALVKVRNQFIGATWYKWINPLQEPFDGGVDDRGQIRVWFNVIGNKRP